MLAHNGAGPETTMISIPSVTREPTTSRLPRSTSIDTDRESPTSAHRQSSADDDDRQSIQTWRHQGGHPDSRLLEPCFFFTPKMKVTPGMLMKTKEGSREVRSHKLECTAHAAFKLGLAAHRKLAVLVCSWLPTSPAVGTQEILCEIALRRDNPRSI